MRTQLSRPFPSAAYTCVAPTYIRNGSFRPRKLSYAVNDTVTFECGEGFHLLGSATRTCLANGRWSGSTAVCDDGGSLCPDPGIPVGGSRKGDSYNEGDVVTYICFSKLVLRGSATRRCEKTGRWQGTEATCEHPFSYDEPEIVAQQLTLSEEILEHAKQGTHLYFLLDASGSVGEENFRKTLDFVDAFSEMTSDISAGMKYFVLVFASTVLSETKSTGSPIYVDTFSHLNYRDFQDNRGTNIGGALMKVVDSVNETVRTTKPSELPRQVLILITDGRHNQGPKPQLAVHRLKEILPAADTNLDIFTIGIGDASKRELEEISTHREGAHSFYFRSYYQLEELTNITRGIPVDVPGCGVRGRSRRSRSLARVYGGENAQEKQWPWQVRVQITTQAGMFMGGGSLVSQNWVLTAAHNVLETHGLVDASGITVFLGSVHRRSQTGLRVSEVHAHPQFNISHAEETGDYAYDIALLRLMKLVTFSETIRPVCLPCTNEVATFLPAPAAPWESQCLYQDRILTGSGGSDWREITGYVTGWGKTEHGGRTHLLQYGRISIKHRDKCLRDHLDETVFCAKGDGVDSCQGDSGGPFTIKVRQRWIQIGIVSSGSDASCHGDNMGYYTNVVRVMDWAQRYLHDVHFK